MPAHPARNSALESALVAIAVEHQEAIKHRKIDYACEQHLTCAGHRAVKGRAQSGVEEVQPGGHRRRAGQLEQGGRPGEFRQTTAEIGAETDA